MKLIPVMPEKCGTCPFRPGSPYSDLADDLAHSALTVASRICHSTGDSVIYGPTGKPPRLCRGARDLQLEAFTALGVIKEPTDAAWMDSCRKLGLLKED